MMTIALLATLLTSATPAELTGSWAFEGQVIFVLEKNGRGRAADGSAIRWSATADTLAFTTDDGESDRVPYALREGRLVIAMNGVELILSNTAKPAEADQPKPAQPAQQTSQLAQLLLSSAWCSFSYSNGTTRKSRVQFFADGSWSSNGNRETSWSGQNGSYYGANGSGAGGRWSAQNEQLMMSMPPQYPSLVPVPFSVTRNSNGYPIITVAGTEYMLCK